MDQNDLQTAIDHHRAGRLVEAAAICRDLLAQNPNDANALNLLGVISSQTGNPDAAAEFLNRAIQFQPDHALAHNNLVLFLRAAGESMRPSNPTDAQSISARIEPNPITILEML